jgi:hypothetical protein
MLFLLLFVDAAFFVKLVHVRGIKPDDQAIHHQRALCPHPKTKGPSKKGEVELSGKVAHYKSDKKPDQQQY